jgi:chemotaxis protein CheX
VGITGSVRDNGMEFNGNISLVFPGELGKVIFRSMMMMEAGDAVEDTELNDVVGELGNMVAGGAKAKLQDEGIDFKIGLPTVVVGNDHHLEPPKKAMVRVVPMQVEAGEFFMEISI